MAQEYVRSYVKEQNYNDRDAEAIAHAATRPTMRFGSKSEEQPDVHTLQRGQDQLVGDRLIRATQVAKRAAQTPTKKSGWSGPPWRSNTMPYLFGVLFMVLCYTSAAPTYWRPAAGIL